MDKSENLIEQFLSDWELGLNRNPGSPAGPRSPPRLKSLRYRLKFISKILRERCSAPSLVDVRPRELAETFRDMEKGVIRKRNDKPFISVDDYVKAYKTFFNWYRRTTQESGIEVKDISRDLSATPHKPGFVYLSEEEFRRVATMANPTYRVLLWFILDSGVRPQELRKITVGDLQEDIRYLNIRDDVAKHGSFGRKIKLLLCNDLLREYIRAKDLKPGDERPPLGYQLHAGRVRARRHTAAPADE